MRNNHREVKFSTTRTGQRRAYYWSGRQLRWFPMPFAEAQLAVATGTATDITATAAF